MMTERVILSPKEVSRIMRCSLQMVYRDLESGLCPGFKVGRNWKVYAKDIEVYIRNKQRQTQDAMRADAEKKRENAKNLLRLQSEPQPKKSSREDIDDIMREHYPDKFRKRKSI